MEKPGLVGLFCFRGKQHLSFSGVIFPEFFLVFSHCLFMIIEGSGAVSFINSHGRFSNALSFFRGSCPVRS